MTRDATRGGRGRCQGLYRPEFEHDACGIGALAHLAGKRSHQMIEDALSVLANLEHRGGVGLEENTGDGAGILVQVPHRFFRKEAQKHGHLLPDEGDYGVAMLFLPRDEAGVAAGVRIFEEGCARCGISLLFWRDVPIDPHDLGSTARACMPTIKQAFVGRPADAQAGEQFERRLYACRRVIEKAAHDAPELAGKIFYACSMSSRTIVYKGMLVSTQMRRFFRDLGDASTETAVALVHSRYSTNTTPSWERAHPNRYLVHNGEINTLRCNVSWTRAREAHLYSPVMGDKLACVLPILNGEGSDSAMLDNVVEFITMNGRSLPRAVSMLVPEPWDHAHALSDKRRAWDAYQSMLTEAWDGPAALAFTDGVVTGAALDRNGLRPARYYVTGDDRLILSSEVGVLDVDPANVLIAGSLGPGQMLLVDPAAGRVLFDDEIKDAFANEKPYRSWIDAETIALAELIGERGGRRPAPAGAQSRDRGSGAAPEGIDALSITPSAIEPRGEAPGSLSRDCAEAGAAGPRLQPRDAALPLHERQAHHGYAYEDVEEAIIPLARTGASPLASMGSDVPLACLSERPRRFFDYFNQLFAQVTNPPIDALRESFITSTLLYVGSHGNLLEDARANCRLVRLDAPILDRAGFEALAGIARHGFKAVTLVAAYRADAGLGALEEALGHLRGEAVKAVRSGANILVISDRVTAGEVPIPSLLATASVHNHLLRCGLRTKADIVVEAGDVVTPHDFACLVGYSASAVFPYLAHDTISALCERGVIEGGAEQAIGNYDRAVVVGIVSIMSKMGISTMQGYQAAQVFEAVGLSDELVEEHLTGTVSRVGGLGIDDVQRECDGRRSCALAQLASPAPEQLPSLGLTSWRPLHGEEHLIDPLCVNLLQRAVREGDFELFEEYSRSVHRPGRTIVLRDLLDFVPGDPVPLAEVEPVERIVRRFNTGAMSYGSISAEAHECLAIAMNRLGGRSNSGEGGEDEAREVALPNGDSKRSAIKQVASGRFGVTSRYLMSADEIQIKMAQGAKPGEGGHLPGEKVWPQIARARRSTPGVGLISPPPHHDIYSIEDLAELIFDLKNANPRARISVKLVAETGVGTIAAGVAKGGAHKILISGANGGTGAAPLDSIQHAGLPLELGLAEAQQTLVRNGLRSRVVLEADGKLMDGRDVAIACLLGAEEFGFATMPLIAMGCLMQRACQRDSCPVGIATQNCQLRGRFSGRPEHVMNFMKFTAEQLRHIMAELGFRTVEEMVGQVSRLRQRTGARSWKARLVDLTPLLVEARAEFGADIPGAGSPHWRADRAPADTLASTLDATLLIPYTHDARAALARQRFRADISNVNRCMGTMLGSAVTARHAEGLPDETLVVDCAGAGGMSFGAFLPAGITLNIRGEANDYLGKGLSGGVVTVAPPAGATFHPEENVVVGNVAFYGATGGRGFVNGLAGQRFAVRNSGAVLVVEGVGNNGCEYMTGGVVLVLGEVGLNFAAGMSGGVAYVYDAAGTLEERCNHEMVRLGRPGREELADVRALIEEHVQRTGSPLGVKLLYRFEDVADDFAKVIPREFERIFEAEQLRPAGAGTVRVGWDSPGRGRAAGLGRPGPQASSERLGQFGSQASSGRLGQFGSQASSGRPELSHAAWVVPNRPSEGSAMGIPGAYLRIGCRAHGVRPAVEATRDFGELALSLPREDQRAQASRCMNCGVAFCQSGIAFLGSRVRTGCPLHNLIPETNDLTCRGRWDDAAARLGLTNPFPEFTGRVCPAPCEVACNLGLHDAPVTICDNERAISDYAWERGMAQLPTPSADAPLVSVVGSGPAGLAIAWELARRGVRVRVWERDERPGGLLMFGIPNMKLPKWVVERRVALMAESGIEFSCGVDAAEVAGEVVEGCAAVVLAIGAREPRRVDVPGADLNGIHFAVDYLSEVTRALLDGREPRITATGKNVVVIGGGDTGVDCVACALRQKAASVRQVIRASRPPEAESSSGSRLLGLADAPVPRSPDAAGAPAGVLSSSPPASGRSFSTWPNPRDVLAQGYGQREAVEIQGFDPRIWSTDTVGFVGEAGAVTGVRLQGLSSEGERRAPVGAEREIPAELVLIAKGFTGPEQAVLDAFGVGDACDVKGAPEREAVREGGMRRGVGGVPVYLAGDVRLGPTLVATAIADALQVAADVHARLEP